MISHTKFSNALVLLDVPCREVGPEELETSMASRKSTYQVGYMDQKSSSLRLRGLYLMICIDVGAGWKQA
jgi:hypothetical protein